jgi:hypothetical protein
MLVDNADLSYISPVKSIIAALAAKKRKLDTCPEGASAKNGGNKIYKTWITGKTHLGSLLNFYKELGEDTFITPRVLFNCQSKLSKPLQELFYSRPYIIPLESLSNTYSFCVSNTQAGLNELDLSEGFIDNIDTIVLFDCDRKKEFNEFALDEITKWNTEYNSSFKRYFLLTFGSSESDVEIIKSHLARIKSRFKIATEDSYVILSNEIDFILNRPEKEPTPITFIGIDNYSSWDMFLQEIQTHELYELRSIKMLNLYSLAYSDEIKNYIIEDLFSKKEESKFISASTKQALIELSQSDILNVRTALFDVLSIIVKLKSSDFIICRIKTDSIILVSDFVLKDDRLQRMVSSALNITNWNVYRSWSTMDIDTKKSIVILAYRDQGRSPYHFSPNILETCFPNTGDVIALLLTVFFGNQYDWAKYSLLKELYSVVANPIRTKYFEWSKLRSNISNIKPADRPHINWALENEYSFQEVKENFRVKFVKLAKPKSYSASDYFITRLDGESEFHVERVKDLARYNFKDNRLLIQSLDEIQEEINIYQKIVDTTQQHQELRIIEEQFGVEKGNAGILWKTLLRRKADVQGNQNLYDEIKLFLTLRKLTIVSFFHFKNSWLDPDSKSVTPLSKAVFTALCEYLIIPRAYFFIVQRIKNASKQASSRTTRHMNQLLKDLFNDRCFDDSSDVHRILAGRISYYKHNHPLDELGIDPNKLIDNLVILVELIKPELELQEVEIIEKIDYE